MGAQFKDIQPDNKKTEQVFIKNRQIKSLEFISVTLHFHIKK